MYKRLWITVNQTNRWAGSVFRGSVWSPATFKKVTAGSQGNFDKGRLCQNVGNVPVAKKCPLKTVALALKDNGMVEKWKCRESLCVGLGWKYKMRLKPGDSPRKGEGWCWKENVNKEHWQMKNNNNNKMKIYITKTSGGSPKQVPSLGVFDYFMVTDDCLWLFMIILWLLIIICNYKMIIDDYFILIC